MTKDETVEWHAMLSRFSRVRLCATLETAAHQAPPSLGFSRQEHWSGLPFPSPRYLNLFHHSLNAGHSYYCKNRILLKLFQQTAL